MTRTAYIAKLNETIAQYAKCGNRNQAVEKHLAKVEAMDEVQFQEHYAALQARTAAAAPSVRRMAAETIRKTHR